MLNTLKTIIVLIAFSLICGNALSQEVPPKHPPLLPGMKYDTIRRMDPDNWEYIQVKMPGGNFPENVLISEGSYHNGKLEGTWIDYWETGMPRTIDFYMNDKKSGISIENDPTGSIIRTINYRNGLLEGPTKVYEPHTGVIGEETYYSEGLKHGRHTKWYPNRSLEEEGNYIHGVLNGLAVWYYDDGKKSVEYTYHNGKLEGSATVYYRDGFTSETGEYKDGAQSGHWKEFHENGNLKEEGEYLNGEKDGTWIEYDILGKTGRPIKYKNGKVIKK